MSYLEQPGMRIGGTVSGALMAAVTKSVCPQATIADIRESRRVLVAEADQASAEMLRELLVSERWTVTVAADIDTAMQSLREGPWRAAIVSSFSYNSQRPAGWAALRRLIGSAGSTPVLLLTGHVLSETDAVELGLAALVRKPYDIDTLLHALEHIH